MSAKNSPGKLRMKCMLWEPQPMSLRKQQDEQFVYNEQTLGLIKNLPEQFAFFPEEPGSIYLKPIHVYRDTFLRIGDEMLQTDREGLLDYKANPLFDTNGVGTSPWIFHQTFRLIGSLFSPIVAAPSATPQNGDVTYNSGVSKWVYGWIDVPNITNGNNGRDLANDFDTTGTVDAKYSKSRLTKRIIPNQIAVSSGPILRTQADATADGGTNGSSVSSSTPTNSTSGPDTPQAIHWLVEKETDLFNREDFFVEFIKQAYQPDIVDTDQPFLSDYYFIDPNTQPSGTFATSSSNNIGDTSGRPLAENAAVIDLGSDGSPLNDDESKIDLSKQPYYLVEVGHNDADHNYLIILPYNGYPIFVHVGKVPVILPAVDAADGTQASPAIMAVPARPVSTRLSTYNVPCKQLMDSDLRITVRNHLGSIAVYFNDDLSNPWIIRRADYDLAQGTSNQNAGVNDFATTNVYMRIPEDKLRIGAGNILCGFTFGPLAYKGTATMALPDAICVRGPVKDSDINCYLREKQTVNFVKRYFQDADTYIEVEKGKQIFTSKPQTLLPTEIDTLVGGSKRAFVPYRKGPDGWLSYISITKNGSLRTLDTGSANATSASTGNSGSNASTTNNQNTIKYFNAAFELGSGDVVVGKHVAGQEWCIANCVTPIATGWRLNVPQSVDSQSVCPVIDVAHHVLSFNANWGFTDNIKVEHSGSIKFLINIGAMTGSQASNPGTADAIQSCDASGSDPYSIDQSRYLVALTDKTFYLRIYAWWEGGYMDCNIAGCPCKKNNLSGGDKTVVFTGLVHGGQVTVEAGKRVMECQLLDYWKILQDSQFLNSPFFDGMRDFNAAYEILQSAGFSDQGGDRWPPAGFIRDCANNPSGIVQGNSNGEFYWIRDYALPSSFDQLQSPILKFADGSKLEEGLIQIAKFGGKMVFFDRYGVFRMQGRPDQYFCNPNNPAFSPRCSFYASPKDIPGQACTQYDAISINAYSYKRVVADVPNEIHIISATPDGALIIGSDVNLASKYDPNAEGYTGYTKRLLQMNGIFGSEAAVTKLMKYYSGFYRPPVILNWESMGIPHLMAGDTVTFTGLQLDDAFPPATRSQFVSTASNTTTVYITSMTTEMDAATNKWTNKYEGEWIFIGELDCNANTANA